MFRIGCHEPEAVPDDPSADRNLANPPSPTTGGLEDRPTRAADVLTADTSVRVDCKLFPGETIGHWDNAYWQGWNLSKVEFWWYRADGQLVDYTNSPVLEGDRARNPSAEGAVRVQAQFDFSVYAGYGSIVHLYGRTSNDCVA